MRLAARAVVSTLHIAAFGLLGLPVAQAQLAPDTANNKPLSVIDWLGTQEQTPTPAAQPLPDEPAVTSDGSIPTVTVEPLGKGRPRQIGLVPSTVTGLPEKLWYGSDPDDLIKHINTLPDLHLPAAQSLMFTVLLAQAKAPAGNAASGDALALARVSRLLATGALDPALSLIEQAGVTTSSAHFDLYMQISLLAGTEDRACALLATTPHLSRDYGTRIFCDARASRWDDAALTYGAALALNLMPEPKLALMDRFLNPDLFEDAAPLPDPQQMDPLSFRIFEAIGEPKSTRTLPRPYAVADLRDLAGWKSQLEAAERLTRVGALPDNRLLGLYTDRAPAASGGVWDRVAALQRFETALETGSADAVAKTLPRAWRAMRTAELEVPFATLFADRLSQITLTGTSIRIARDMTLLSPAYETAPTPTPDLLSQIAAGQTTGRRPAAPLDAAIYDAFNDAPPPARLLAEARQDRLGETILKTLTLLHEGARGDPGTLRDALATLRALGLEDTARRAALQILILERS